MKPLTLFFALLFALLQCAQAEPVQIQPASAAPITLETNLDTRATFEAIGQGAGINVVSRSLNTTPVPFKVENKSVTEALELLSKQTNTFWTPWDSKTILVFPDTAENRRTYDRQFLQKISMDRPVDQVLQELRNANQLRGIASGSGAILLRETRTRIRQAETLLGKTGTPVGGSDLSNVYLTEAGGLFRTPDSVRSELKVRFTDPISFNVTADIRTAFEALANMSGVNIVFGRNSPTRQVTFRIAGVNCFDALDLLALSTGSFWQPLNETTIMVYDDTLQNRRDFESQLMETVYVSPSLSTQRLNEIMVQLRTFLSLRGVYQDDPAKAVFVRDRASNVLLAEALIEEMAGTPIRKETTAGVLEGFSESGGPFRKPQDVRSQLQTKIAGTISVQMNATAQEIFGQLVAVAGLDLLYSGPTRVVSFNVENRDIVDALDLLAMQSGVFWQPMNSRMIQVIEDTQQNRRDFEALMAKTIYLPSATSSSELNTIMNVLRTALSLRGIYQYEGAKAIFVRDTPGRVALTERIIRQLNVRAADVTSVSLSVPGLTEGTIRGTASVARPMLRTTGGQISLNMNQDVRTSFETVGRMAGLTVSFDPRVIASGAIRLNMNDVDALDALDCLSFQTRTFWTVVDDHTILVAPDTQQAHNELETRLAKVFYLTNPGSAATIGIVNVLRTALSLRQVFEQAGTGAIEMWDTPQRLAFVEKVIASLDRTR
jgi:type II secretory pathway component GspD/PulD (secretin)